MTPANSDLAFSRSAYPVFAIVAVLAAIHLVRQTLDPTADFWLVSELAFVPAQFTLLFDRETILRAAARAIAQNEISSTELAYLLGDGPRWWTWITYSALHGGLAHLVMNSVWLLAFGTAVARRFGGARFFAFFIFTAVAGALAFYIVHPFGLAPVIGASAAISGAMGAAVRFAFSPGAPLGTGFSRERSLDAYRQPAPSLRDVLQERRAITFLVLWFALNFIFGAVAPIGAEGPVAWEAHIGGFLAGFVGFALFDRAHDAHPLDDTH